VVAECVFLLWILTSELILRSRIKYGSKEKQMLSRRKILIAALVVALAVFTAVVTIVGVLALLTAIKTVPSNGTVNPAAQQFGETLPFRARTCLTISCFGAFGVDAGYSQASEKCIFTIVS
jgi:ABC-type transport system involved in multi-copper enzyme maturation permease subunit